MNKVARIMSAVAVALGALTTRSAPLVRIGEAEVGFRMHLGVMKLSGVDISNDDMAELSVTTNGTTITGVWKGHPLFGDGFTATATFTEKDGGWEYAFGWTNLDGWKFFVETVSFPDLVVPRTDKSGVLYSRNHGMGMIRRPTWSNWGWEREPFVNEGMREFQFTALIDDEKGSWYVDARDPLARYKMSYAYCRIGLGDPHARMGIRAFVPMAREQTVAGALPWKGLIRPFRGGWWEAAQIYRPWAREQAWAKAAEARRGTPGFLGLSMAMLLWFGAGVFPAVFHFLARHAADQRKQQAKTAHAGAFIGAHDH